MHQVPVGLVCFDAGLCEVRVAGELDLLVAVEAGLGNGLAGVMDAVEIGVSVGGDDAGAVGDDGHGELGPVAVAEHVAAIGAELRDHQVAARTRQVRAAEVRRPVGVADQDEVPGGVHVDPGEAEQALAQLDGVADVAVIGGPDERRGEGGKAYGGRAEGATLTGKPVRLLTNHALWHGRVIEAPQMHVRDGRYYLFYSAHAFDSSNYAVGYALCEGPLGPCQDAQENPILKGFPVFDLAQVEVLRVGTRPPFPIDARAERDPGILRRSVDHDVRPDAGQSDLGVRRSRFLASRSLSEDAPG